MYVSFDQLPPTARLWVYQANRALTRADITAIEAAMQPALAGWVAHGQPLLASARVVENRFLLVGADEAAALPSGCSIDASVQVVQHIGQQIGVDFMDRSVTYLANGVVASLPLAAVKEAFANGTLTAETPIVNTLIKTNAEYPANWIIPAGQTWLKRYLKPVAM